VIVTSETTAQIRDRLYDPLAEAVIADPYRYYGRLRAHTPVYWHAMLDSWLVTGYLECRQALGDTTAFASDFRRVGEEVPAAQLSIQSLDPPEHGAIRHLLVAALHEQMSPLVQRRIGAIAAERLDRLALNEPVDLISQFARPIAIRAIAAFLGVEAPAGTAFEELSNAIVRSMDAGIEPGRAAPGNDARAELSRMIGEWMDHAEGEAFLAAAVRAGRTVPEVTPAILTNSLRAVLHAGYESVSRLLGNVLGRLSTADAMLLSVARHGEITALTDELIRLDTPVQADARVCVRDCTLGAQPIRRGDVVVLMLAAANRDPGVFPHPDVVDLSRRRGMHLAFGRGAHACLGARLGTQQLHAVLMALRTSGIYFVPAGAARHEPTATLRGLTELPVYVRRIEDRPVQSR
jgi:cytochrome P450